MEDHEKELLSSYSKEFNAQSELDWASEFVQSDILTTFKRSRIEVNQLLGHNQPDQKIDVLSRVWEATKTKGYINQQEAGLLLDISRDWHVETQLIDMVKSN